MATWIIYNLSAMNAYQTNKSDLYYLYHCHTDLSAYSIKISLPEPRAQSARGLRAKPESRAKPELEWRGVWGGCLVSHSPENCCKLVLEIVQSGVYNYCKNSTSPSGGPCIFQS